MKHLEFELEKKDIDKFFTPIRVKYDVIRILMYSIKFMLIDKYITKTDICGKIILKIDKTSRLFFFIEEKYYSITFPFSTLETKEGLSFSSKYIEEIDSQLTSDVINLLKCSNDNYSQCGYDFIEPILEYSEHRNKYIWSLIHELIFNEDGYLRFDIDKENQNGKIHPINHYDIFYSNKATFKIGLKEAICDKDIIDLVNLDTDCHFIAKT